MTFKKNFLALPLALAVLGYESTYPGYGTVPGDKAVIVTGAEIRDEERSLVHNSF